MGATRLPGEIPDGAVDAMMRLARQTGLAIEVADHAREMADVAVHEERRHLALTIHDSVGAILFSIGAAARDLETEREANRPCGPACATSSSRWPRHRRSSGRLCDH